MSRSTSGANPRWEQWSDADLLKLRFSDLGLSIAGSWVEEHIGRLYEELDRRGIRFKPHVWISTEWFSPDGVPGIAVPFYLVHPRLRKLERSMMLEVEGGTRSTCMKILRHEAGHAIDTAYRLHFKKRWRDTFGRYSDPYPRFYRPRPNSKRFVVHLDGWYAQAHPAEDYAETFAVWLTPRSRWRQAYSQWPQALKKLKCVDELLAEIQDSSPRNRSRGRPDSLSRISTTLEDHYRRKRRHYGIDIPESIDAELERLFYGKTRSTSAETAAQFLKANRQDLVDSVSAWTGSHHYTVDQVLRQMVERCRLLKLRRHGSQKEARMAAAVLLTVHTMNLLRTKGYELPL